MIPLFARRSLSISAAAWGFNTQAVTRLKLELNFAWQELFASWS